MTITNVGTSPIVPYQSGTPQEGPAYFTFAIVLPANQISISQSKPFPIGMSQVLSVLVDNRTNNFDITVSFAGGSNFQVGQGQSTIVPVFAPASSKTLDVELSVNAAQSSPSVIVFQAFNVREDLQILGNQQATISGQTSILGSRIVNPIVFTNNRNLTQKFGDAYIISSPMALSTAYAPIQIPAGTLNPNRLFDFVITNNASGSAGSSATIYVSEDGVNDTFVGKGLAFIEIGGSRFFSKSHYARASASITVNITFAFIPDYTFVKTNQVFDTVNFVFGSSSFTGGILNFNISSTLAMPAPPIFGDTWTIECWLRYPPPNFSTGLSILNLANPNSLTISLTNTGYVSFLFYGWKSSSTPEYTFNSKFKFNDANFHHFALVSDGYTLKLFVDGVLDSAFAFPIYLGAYDSIQIGDLLSKANIDELALWQIPRYFNNFSSSQVGAPFSQVMPGLAALWHFESADTNVYDYGPGAFTYY